MLHPECQNGNECSDPGSPHCLCARETTEQRYARRRLTGSPLEDALFAFLERKYFQEADARQRAMGLQYTTAETHDLAHELTLFIVRNVA